MNIIKLTKKQVIIRLILLAVFAVAGYILLCIRACPTWHDKIQIPPEVRDPDAALRSGDTQESRIPPPEGFERISAAEGSFLQYMRNIPVWEKGSSVMTYDGKPLSGANAAAVYTISLPESGYQQCADTVIRLWSDYLFSTQQYDRIAFSYSNGFETNYADWRAGWRYLTVPVADLTFRLKLKGQDSSEQQFYNYLQSVMRYAGTLSLEAESQPIAVSEAHAGDIICKGGAPGHVVLIVDEAVNAAGERRFLLAQGFMPSQSAHIIAGYGIDGDPWYTEEQLGAEPIALSSYTFHSGALRRWKTGF